VARRRIAARLCAWMPGVKRASPRGTVCHVVVI
jgi:hypothetical protein